LCHRFCAYRSNSLGRGEPWRYLWRPIRRYG
jgi:hypothetical protein